MALYHCSSKSGRRASSNTPKMKIERIAEGKNIFSRRSGHSMGTPAPGARWPTFFPLLRIGRIVEQYSQFDTAVTELREIRFARDRRIEIGRGIVRGKQY
jgi:hypothetical protein